MECRGACVSIPRRDRAGASAFPPPRGGARTPPEERSHDLEIVLAERDALETA